jgi:hypothetical protein
MDGMSTAVDGSLTIIGVSVVAHTKLLANVKAYIQGKVTGNTPQYTGTLTVGSFGLWAGAFIGLAVILELGDDSDKYGDIFKAFAVLIATASLFAYYQDLAALFGSVSTTTNTGGSTPQSSTTPPSGGTLV